MRASIKLSCPREEVVSVVSLRTTQTSTHPPGLSRMQRKILSNVPTSKIANKKAVNGLCHPIFISAAIPQSHLQLSVLVQIRAGSN